MKMGLLADDRWRSPQLKGEGVMAHHHAAFMGGVSHTSFPPGYKGYSPALNHARHGFSMDYPYYTHTSVGGDRVDFSSEAGFYKPARY